MKPAAFILTNSYPNLFSFLITTLLYLWLIRKAELVNILIHNCFNHIIALWGWSKIPQRFPTLFCWTRWDTSLLLLIYLLHFNNRITLCMPSFLMPKTPCTHTIQILCMHRMSIPCPKPLCSLAPPLIRSSNRFPFSYMHLPEVSRIVTPQFPNIFSTH